MSERGYPRLFWGGDGCLIAEFGESIDISINVMVRALAESVEEAHPKWLVETVPTYRSLAVFHDPWYPDRDEIMGQVRALCLCLKKPSVIVKNVIRIPVCYGGEFGPDIAKVSAWTGLSHAEIIDLHSSPGYYVFMLGFSPGFPYLGGMDPRLETPRLDDPRTSIPAGSVGIAGKQTGIYSIQSPGGWNLIGRTPLKLFDPSRGDPFLVKAGMEIRFFPVSENTYAALNSSGGGERK